MNAYEVASHLYDLTLRGEAGIVADDGLSLPSDGYYVAGRGEVVFDHDEFDRGEAAWFIGSHRAVFYAVTQDESKKVHVCSMSHLATERAAVAIAKIRKQSEIWDVAAGAGIPVDPSAAF
jgi:hypothetical protein